MKNADRPSDMIKALIRLAEHGVELCVNNSRPEERGRHRKDLELLIAEANARASMMDAAPELLEALEEMESYFADAFRVGGNYAIEKARAAIKKAKGL